jgi:hypothetical protein
MTSEEFVKNFYIERQRLIDLYFDGQEQTDVSKMIQSLNLDDNKLKTVKEILIATLRDAFYTTLLGIDGEAQIGDRQEMYRLTDEKGNELTGGEIESFAWEYFHNAKAIS